MLHYYGTHQFPSVSSPSGGQNTSTPHPTYAIFGSSGLYTTLDENVWHERGRYFPVKT